MACSCQCVGFAGSRRDRSMLGQKYLIGQVRKTLVLESLLQKRITTELSSAKGATRSALAAEAGKVLWNVL